MPLENPRIHNGYDVPSMTLLSSSPDPVAIGAYIESQKNKKLEPEKMLALRILEDAFEFIASTNESKRHGREEAIEWMQSAEREWIFSFEKICEILDFDPSYIRRGLMRYV